MQFNADLAFYLFIPEIDGWHADTWQGLEKINARHVRPFGCHESQAIT